MSRCCATPRGISKHQSYLIADIASALRVSRGTVQRWIKAGLPVMAEKKPYLVNGADLIEFHAARRAVKQKCRVHECYCFKCRVPREPAGDVADLIVGQGSTGNLQALCAVCLTPMQKRISLKRLDEMRNVLDVAIKQAPARIGE